MTSLPTKEEIASLGRAAWHEMMQAHKYGVEKAIYTHNEAWQFYNNLLREGKYQK